MRELAWLSGFVNLAGAVAYLSYVAQLRHRGQQPSRRVDRAYSVIGLLGAIVMFVCFALSTN